MSFTTQPPTIPGAYRWRISADMPDVHLAEVSDADGMLVAQRGSNPARYCVELCGGEWEGPLVIAEEAQAIDHPKNLKRHRARFEKWILGSPYWRSAARFSEDELKVAWPGQYHDIETQLAWESWCEALKAESSAAGGLARAGVSKGMTTTTLSPIAHNDL
jgi:hypothetical protein